MSATRGRDERGGALKTFLLFLLALFVLCLYGVYACTKKVVGAVGDGAAAITRKFDGEWDDAEKKADPAGYLGFLVDRLKANVRELEASRDGLARTEEAVAKKAAEARAKVAAADGDLAALRDRFRAVAAGEATWPVRVGGESLDEPSLKERVGRLLASRAAQEKIAREFDAAAASVAQARAAIPDRIAATESRMALLEARQALVQTGAVEADLGRLLDETGDLIAQNVDAKEKAAAASGVSIRTLDELLKEEAGRSASAAGSADSFLKGR